VPRGDYFLFPKLKMALKGKRFNDITMIQAKSQAALVEFQKLTSGNVSECGTITGLNVRSLKKITRMGTP
jgi:hypothetical protein